MFEVNGRYANRRGEYTVLSLNPPKMTVRYDDSSTAELRIDIQERIWENIQAEIEAASATSRRRSPSSAQGVNFYIKAISVVATDDLSMPGLKDTLAIVTETEAETEGPNSVQSGDRFIYIALEPQVLVAVATVTGKPTAARGVLYNLPHLEEVWVYPLDVDASVTRLETGISLESVELESQPDFRARLNRPGVTIPITEDEFELLAELLTEISEDDEFEDDDDEVEIEEESEIEV